MGTNSTMAVPMDAVSREAYDEWRSSEPTKILVSRMKEDIETLTTRILNLCQGPYSDKDVLEGARILGSQLASRQSLMSYITERSDG